MDLPDAIISEPTGPGETFLHADEVDEPPPSLEDFPKSKQHTIPITDLSNAPGLDTVERQKLVADEVQESDQAAGAPGLEKPILPEILSLNAHTPQDGPQSLSALLDGQPQIPVVTGNDGQKSARDVSSSARPGLKRGTSALHEALQAAQEIPPPKMSTLKGVPPYPDQGRNDAPSTEQLNDSVTMGHQLAGDLYGEWQPSSSYAFQYEDSANFAEELEEIFEYAAEERQTLLRAQKTFASQWDLFRKARPGAYAQGEIDWQPTEDLHKIEFLHGLRADLLGADSERQTVALRCALYLALGCWTETATGIREEELSREDTHVEGPHHFARDQLDVQRTNVQWIGEELGVDAIYSHFRHAYRTEDDLEDGLPEPHGSPGGRDQQLQEHRWTCLVLMNVVVAVARQEEVNVGTSELRRHITDQDTSILTWTINLLSRTRFDDSDFVVSPKMLLLCWRLILLYFGGIDDISQIKERLKDSRDEHQESEGPRFTASPLDYHMFRQEIISKYPAFDPPPALFPFEPDSSSFVPPLPDHSNRPASMPTATSEAGPGNIQASDTSIMQQPVHIATPAPSPPPSPAGPGGKGIKKQNYQTNQMFPFLYPPLDKSSNDLGGRGSTELQDLLAGRKWQGKDIPASILEAADLFSQRMRATRAMKQMWEERVRFLRFERGQDDVDDFDLDDRDGYSRKETGVNADLRKLDPKQRVMLDAVDDFYDENLARLQSLVMVLMKVFISCWTTLYTQPHATEGQKSGESPADQSARPKAESNGEANGPTDQLDDPALNDTIALRSMEIQNKASTGILILLLKWFRLSHILKFEYLSQLLLDNNYINLVLRIFTQQELERAVNFKCERKELNFLTWCRTHSRHPPPKRSDTQSTNANSDSAPSEAPTSPDDALPPPIPRGRHFTEPTLQPPIDPTRELTASPPSTNPPPQAPPTNAAPAPPEVDELGYPTNDPPTHPITHFSWRTFFASINHLRTLQKLLKAKPHRQLLMVQLKSAMTLKKHLRVPQALVRLYTLKIIKGQVPYCHRKWRQSNMRIITAIYLHVKPGLRDEWLSGLDVEQELNEATPMEQALRALTWWWHLKNWPDQMGGKGLLGDTATGNDGVKEEERLSGFVRDKLEQVEREMEAREKEDDDRLVDEILGTAPDGPQANGDIDGEGWMNDQFSDIQNDHTNLKNTAEEARQPNSNFDIDYDPFTRSGRVGKSSTCDSTSPFDLDPSSASPFDLDPDAPNRNSSKPTIATFTSPYTSLRNSPSHSPHNSRSNSRRPSTQHSTQNSQNPRRDSKARSSTSSTTSRRASLRETLLGTPPPTDDFFLRELEKMDLSDRLGDGDGDVVEGVDGEGEREGEGEGRRSGVSSLGGSRPGSRPGSRGGDGDGGGGVEQAQLGAEAGNTGGGGEVNEVISGAGGAGGAGSIANDRTRDVPPKSGTPLQRAVELGLWSQAGLPESEEALGRAMRLGETDIPEAFSQGESMSGKESLRRVESSDDGSGAVPAPRPPGEGERRVQPQPLRSRSPPAAMSETPSAHVSATARQVAEQQEAQPQQAQQPTQVYVHPSQHPASQPPSQPPSQTSSQAPPIQPRTSLKAGPKTTPLQALRPSQQGLSQQGEGTTPRTFNDLKSQESDAERDKERLLASGRYLGRRVEAARGGGAPTQSADIGSGVESGAGVGIGDGEAANVDGNGVAGEGATDVRGADVQGVDVQGVDVQAETVADSEAGMAGDEVKGHHGEDDDGDEEAWEDVV